MIYTTLLKDTGGTVISDFAITGSGVTIPTTGIDTSRWGHEGGIYLVATGSITITRQVSLDDTVANYGSPFNLVGADLSPVWTTTDANANTPIFISLGAPHDSAGVVGPYLRFSILANNSTTINSSANTITTMAYCVPENNA